MSRLSLQRTLSTPLMAMIFCCALSSALRAQPISGPPSGPAEYGRHFIVLIDDSGSMRPQSRRQAVGVYLPQLLYAGITSGGQTLPGFNPQRDKVSIVFFTILKDPGGCGGGRKAYSSDLDDIFELAKLSGRIGSRENFAALLNEQLYRGCRFVGQYSPIAISQLLALPYVQRSLPAGEIYSQTILIVASDGEYNASSPSNELIAFSRKGVEIRAAQQLHDRVNRFFDLNTPPNWLIQRGGLFFLFAELRPRYLAESSIRFLSNDPLEPQAVSGNQLRYALRSQSDGNVQILPKRLNSDYEFKPLWFRVGFENSAGTPWRIGDRDLPRESKPLYLPDCKFPECREKDGVRGVSIFDIAENRALASPDDPDPEPSRIKFRVGFNYRTEFYDHLYVETPEQVIAAELASPVTLPNFLFFLPAKQLTKEDLVEEYKKDDDGVTTPEEARNRLQSTYNLIWAGLAIALVIATIFGAVYLFLTAYHRRFHPELKWSQSPELVVDFDRPAANRSLIGTLKVVNHQPVPWLGRVLKNEEQPTRQAEISLNYNSLDDKGLKISEINPIGFVLIPDASSNGQGGSPNLLTRTIKENVSDGKQIHVFLAAETIEDFLREQPAHREIPVLFVIHTKMGWTETSSDRAQPSSMIDRAMRHLRSRLATDPTDNVSLDMDCELIVKPEAPRKPRVTYIPNSEKLHFSKGDEIEIGRFVFSSQADHQFAEPFVSGAYAVQTYKDNRPLSGEPIKLGEPRVTVRAQRQCDIPVLIVCDGEEIENPGPASVFYTFKLIGEFDAASAPGPHSTMLYRDPARAEIELLVEQRGAQREIFWTPEGLAKQRLLLPDGSGAQEREIDAELLEFDESSIEFDPQTARPRNLVTIKVGNTANSGRGFVAVDINARIYGEKETLDTIVMANNSRINDLVGIYELDERRAQIHVNEGDAPQIRDVRFDPGLIQRIIGARIQHERLGVEIDLKIHVLTDQGEETRRELKFRLPVRLEQLPGLNWLAIDFGTSAIAAALGAGGGIVPIPLQEIKVEGGISLGEYDLSNPEHDNSNLLPSWVVCDADLRTGSQVKSNPGFPGYFDEEKKLSLTPGEADFVGLPALGRQLAENPERVIYSLKSWLGKSSRNIKLQSPIEFRDDGGELIKSDTLPLDKVIESGFAALTDAYLFDTAYRADQIVLTHPNTFTQRHKELLHDIALRVFGKPERFGIPLPERIQLISESDAVAYYYCTQQMRRRPRKATERILVYDFGAGTLDLSMIKIEWKSGEVTYPSRWEVEGRIGVPVAGNYIDEVIARIVDRLLRDKYLSGADAVEYQFPVVAGSFGRKNKRQYRRAVVDLWAAIREAKHQWDGQSPMNIKVGYLGSADGIVTETVRDKLPTAPPDYDPGLWEDGSAILISIPDRVIHDDDRMSEFIRFVTSAVIDELFYAAKVVPDSVDTIIVSGRGALWPGLREHVRDRFRKAYKPGWDDNSDMDDAIVMKDSVVRGAIARQDLLVTLDDAGYETRWQPKLGALINHDEDLIIEDDWDKPIDLTRSPTFRIVQVNLRNPNPREDTKSLRKHFYIDLADQVFRREGVWARTRELWIRKTVQGGKLGVYLEDRDKTVSMPIFTQTRTAETITAPPWPVGNFLLDPNG